MLGVVGEERHKNFKIRDSGAEIEGKQNFTEIQISLDQGWAIPESVHQYYTQYYTGQKLLSNTNTQYQYYTKLNPQSKLGTAQPRLFK